LCSHCLEEVILPGVTNTFSQSDILAVVPTIPVLAKEAKALLEELAV
jgi:hypothetical protein